MNRRTKHEIKLWLYFSLAVLLITGLLAGLIVLGAKTYGYCELECDKPLKISRDDELNARLGAYRNGTITTYGRIPVRVSLQVEQANSYSIDNNFNEIQGTEVPIQGSLE